MSTASRSPVKRTTVNCYEFWDRVFQRAGVLDYTEGFYDGDPTRSFEEAQHRQIRFLLDAVGCCDGSRVLDIGCGNGTVLDEVWRRGATGVGITISPEQVRCCTRRGLDARLLNYRDVGEDLSGRFDAVVANGSIEHFVQPADALERRADTIYREFFAICHRVIDPRSASRRLVNTTIHLGNFQADPQEAMRRPWYFPWLTDKFHYACLMHGFGGCYPSLGQFERCARPNFKLVSERDATYDYHLTSEEWLRHGRRSCLSPRQWGRLFPFLVRHPCHATRMLFLLLVAQSWNWQFRTDKPPMKHLWQTWEYVE